MWANTFYMHKVASNREDHLRMTLPILVIRGLLATSQTKWQFAALKIESSQMRLKMIDSTFNALLSC